MSILLQALKYKAALISEEFVMFLKKKKKKSIHLVDWFYWGFFCFTLLFGSNTLVPKQSYLPCFNINMFSDQPV